MLTAELFENEQEVKVVNVEPKKCKAPPYIMAELSAKEQDVKVATEELKKNIAPPFPSAESEGDG